MSFLRKFFKRKPDAILNKMVARGLNFGHDQISNWGLTYLDKQNIKASNILDAGCGGGQNISSMLLKYPEAKITGVDYSALSVADAIRFNSDEIASGRCKILEGNIMSLKFFDGNIFDLVTAFETIFYWPELEKCFSEIYRILVPDGNFMIVNRCDDAEAVGLRFARINEVMKVYTLPEIESALKGAGFKNININRHNYLRWVCMFAKK